MEVREGSRDNEGVATELEADRSVNTCFGEKLLTPELRWYRKNGGCGPTTVSGRS